MTSVDRRYDVVLVNDADDFVMLCRHGAAEVLETTRRRRTWTPPRSASTLPAVKQPSISWNRPHAMAAVAVWPAEDDASDRTIIGFVMSQARRLAQTVKP
jgi:hypothetical protein